MSYAEPAQLVGLCVRLASTRARFALTLARSAARSTVAGVGAT
jgi:hypothetical protein